MGNQKLNDFKKKRVSGPILLIPLSVLNSIAYLTLPSNAKALLFDIAMQYNKLNNGRLLASWRFMSEKRGWTSCDALSKAKRLLIEHELIIQTVQGRLPNKASWYGLTWFDLDKNNDFEISFKHWPRGIFMNWKPTGEIKSKRKPPSAESREKYYENVRQKRNPTGK